MDIMNIIADENMANLKFNYGLASLGGRSNF